MGDRLTLGERYTVIKRGITEKIKASLLNDTPPGVHLLRGMDVPTIDQIKSLSDRHSLASFLPYESYDEETGLYFNKDTVGFLLYCSPCTGMSAQELRVLNGIFNQNHKPDTNIQITMYSDPNVEPILNNWRNNKVNNKNVNIAKIFKLLADNRVNYLRKGKWNSLFTEQALLVRNYHLMVSYTIPVPKGVAPVDTPENELEFLMRMREAFIGSLRSARIFAERMNPALFINIMDGLLNPSQEPKRPLYYDDQNIISSQMVDSNSAIVFDSGVSTILHDDKAYSVMPFHVRQFPQQWAGFSNGELIGSFTNNILRLSCPAVMTLSVNIPDQVSQKGRVKAKTTRATQMASSAIAKYATQWADRRQDWKFVSDKVDNGNKLLQAFYQVLLIAPQGKEQECEQSLKSVYDSIGWTLSRSRYTPMHTLLGALPMGLDQETVNSLKAFKHFSSRLSWTCTNVAPWVAEWKGTNTAMMMFTGRRGQLTYFDPFDNDKGNYNISCCAASGGGKSFFTQEWVFSCLGTGGRAFVIDAGHSYRNINKLLDGTYIDFGEGQPILNPFTKFFSQDALRLIDDNPELELREYIDDHLPMLKMLIGQMASPSEDLSSKQKAVLEKAIVSAITEHKDKTTITHVAMECLNQKDEDGTILDTAKDMSLMLHSYTKDGMYGRYFEGENNIDLDNPFVVLEIDALNSKGDLQSVVLLILMMQINQVMYLSGNKKQRKLCIIDEAWRLLGKGRAGEFIEEGYRVARKHGGSFMTITQKISDYYSSETAKAAYMNSDFSIFLRQKPEELSQAETSGHIDNSDGKLEILRSLETKQGLYSELAISSPDGLSVVRFTVDPVTEKIYSTKADEVEYIRDAESRGVDMFDAINELIVQGKTR